MPDGTQNAFRKNVCKTQRVPPGYAPQGSQSQHRAAVWVSLLALYSGWFHCLYKGRGRCKERHMSAHEGRVVETRMGKIGAEGREGEELSPPARTTTSAFFRAALRFCRIWRGWLRPSRPRDIPPRKQGTPRVSTAALGCPGRAEVSMAKASGMPETKTMILRFKGRISSPKLVGRGRRQQGLASQHQQGPLGPAQDLHTALDLW